MIQKLSEKTWGVLLILLLILFVSFSLSIIWRIWIYKEYSNFLIPFSISLCIAIFSKLTELTINTKTDWKILSNPHILFQSFLYFLFLLIFRKSAKYKKLLEKVWSAFQFPFAFFFSKLIQKLIGNQSSCFLSLFPILFCMIIVFSCCRSGKQWENYRKNMSLDAVAWLIVSQHFLYSFCVLNR